MATSSSSGTNVGGTTVGGGHPTSTTTASYRKSKAARSSGGGGSSSSSSSTSEPTAGDIIRAWRAEANPTYESLRARAESVVSSGGGGSSQLKQQLAEQKQIEEQASSQLKSSTSDVKLKAGSPTQTTKSLYSSSYPVDDRMSSAFGDNEREVYGIGMKGTATGIKEAPKTGIASAREYYRTGKATAYGGRDITKKVSKTEEPKTGKQAAKETYTTGKSTAYGVDITKKVTKPDLNIQKENVISVAPAGLAAAQKRQTGTLFKTWETAKEMFQFSPSSRDDFTGKQNLELALTGRNPITGEIESKAAVRTRTAATILAPSASIFTLGDVVPAGLGLLDKGGNIIKATKVVQTIDKTGKVGRIATGLAIRGGEAYVTLTAGQAAVDALAPYEVKQTELTGISEKQADVMFNIAKNKEIAAGFKREESDSILGNIVSYPKAFFTGSVGTLVPGLSSSKDVFSQSVEEQAEELGLDPMQIELVKRKQEQQRRSGGVVQTVALLQGEAFANVAGSKEVELAKAAGKFSTAGGWFAAKVVPSSIEAGVSSMALLKTTKSQLPVFKPRIEDVPLQGAYNSLTDPNAMTKRFNVTEEEFAKIGIVEGGKVPAGLLPDKTNIIYTITGDPTSEDVVSFTQKGNEIFKNVNTTITTPTREFTISQHREEEKPVTDLFSGLYVSGGKQKKFVPSQALLTATSIPVGIVSGGLFGMLEGKFSGAVGSRIVPAAGYTLDVAEGPGDFLTPILTSGRDSTVNVVTGTQSFANIFNQAPTTTNIDVQLDTKNVIKTDTVQKIQTITATRTMDFSTDLTGTTTDTKEDTKRKTQSRGSGRGRSKALQTTELFSLVDTPVKTKIDVMSNVPSNVITNVNTSANQITDVLTNVDTIQDVWTMQDILTDVKADTMTDTMTDVNTNVNVFTPKGFPFFWLGGGVGGGAGLAREGKKGKKKFGYTASLEAKARGIYGKAPKTMGGIFSGQEFRPLLGKQKTKSLVMPKFKTPKFTTKKTKKIKAKKIKITKFKKPKKKKGSYLTI